MTHDPLCPISSRPCCPWMGDCECQCECDWIARVREDAARRVFGFHPEWTVTGMCQPDCLACRRLTELINERSAGYREGRADALAEAREAMAGADPYWKLETSDGESVFVMQVSAALAAIDALRGSGNPHTPPSAEKGEQA